MKRLLWLVSTFLLLSCGVSINFDYDSNADFESYKTYTYYNDMNTGLTVLDERRLVRAMDSALSKRRFVKVSKPDFLIDIKGQSYEEENRTNVGVAVGGTGGNTFGNVNVNVPLNNQQSYDEMVIEFVDERTGETFWLADINVILSTADQPEKRDEYFSQLAEKILKKYPPAKENKK